ncbi:unnamed protein product [Diplocarpon coronariae]
MKLTQFFLALGLSALVNASCPLETEGLPKKDSNGQPTCDGYAWQIKDFCKGEGFPYWDGPFIIRKDDVGEPRHGYGASATRIFRDPRLDPRIPILFLALCEVPHFVAGGTELPPNDGPQWWGPQSIAHREAGGREQGLVRAGTVNFLRFLLLSKTPQLRYTAHVTVALLVKRPRRRDAYLRSSQPGPIDQVTARDCVLCSRTWVIADVGADFPPCPRSELCRQSPLRPLLQMAVSGIRLRGDEQHQRGIPKAAVGMTPASSARVSRSEAAIRSTMSYGVRDRVHDRRPENKLASTIGDPGQPFQPQPVVPRRERLSKSSLIRLTGDSNLCAPPPLRPSAPPPGQTWTCSGSCSEDWVLSGSEKGVIDTKTLPGRGRHERPSHLEGGGGGGGGSAHALPPDSRQASPDLDRHSFREEADDGLGTHVLSSASKKKKNPADSGSCCRRWATQDGKPWSPSPPGPEMDFLNSSYASVSASLPGLQAVFPRVSPWLCMALHGW